MRRPARPLVTFCTVALALGCIAADLGAEAYRLPLVEPYVVYRRETVAGSREGRGVYELVQASARQGVGFSGSKVVPDLESVAVHDRVSFGKSKDGFFLLDARRPDAEAETFDQREPWRAALREVGVTDVDVLKTPDVLAASLPDAVLRPWKYRVMRNRFGMSDDRWSLVVQVLGFIAAFLLGLAWTPGRSPTLAAVALGVAVNVVAQIVIAGGGPGAFVGFVALPLFCVVAATVGKAVRAVVAPAAVHK
jgi:hypothetical protein